MICLEPDYIESYLKDSIIEIQKDRIRYIKVYECIEEFCKKNNVIISSPLNLVETSQIYNYTLYTSHRKHAKELTDAIYRTAGLAKMKTITPDEYIIDHDMRMVAHIFVLPKINTVYLQQLISPIVINGLQYLPPDLELIDIYHKLY